jgi:Predicted transcriptional regulator
MKFEEQIKRLERMHNLIKRKATGSPIQFSQKLGLSLRQLYRIIALMKNLGASIDYSQSRQTYFYFEEGDFVIMKWIPNKHIETKLNKNGKLV